MGMTSAERSAAYRARNLAIYRARKNAYAKTPQEREKRRLYMQKWRAVNREHYNAWANENCKKLRAKYPERSRINYLRRLYGLTPEGYDAMLAAQSGCCAICGTNKPMTTKGKTARFHIDHCHATDRVRGILCNKCNTNLGVLEVWYAKHEAKIRAYLAK